MEFFILFVVLFVTFETCRYFFTKIGKQFYKDWKAKRSKSTMKEVCDSEVIWVVYEENLNQFIKLPIRVIEVKTGLTNYCLAQDLQNNKEKALIISRIKAIGIKKGQELFSQPSQILDILKIKQDNT